MIGAQQTRRMCFKRNKQHMEKSAEANLTNSLEIKIKALEGNEKSTSIHVNDAASVEIQEPTSIDVDENSTSTEVGEKSMSAEGNENETINLPSKYIKSSRCPKCHNSVPHCYVRISKADTSSVNEHTKKPLALKCPHCRYQLPQSIIRTYVIKKNDRLPPELMSRFSHGSGRFKRAISMLFEENVVENKTTCHICGGLYLTRNMDLHMRRHNPSFEKCELCEKFLKSITIKKHVNEKHENEEHSYVCEICGLVYNSKSTLNRHILHHKDLQLKCGICTKVFKNSRYLEQHLFSHTKEQPYQCTDCERKFSWKKNLLTHMRLHTNSKPYRCQYCSEAFRHNVTLKRHIVLKHPGCALPYSKIYKGRPKKSESDSQIKF